MMPTPEARMGWHCSHPRRGWLLLLLSCSVLPVFAYDTPEDCAWSKVEGREQGVFLSCKLSSINSRLERTNFSVIPSDQTLGLEVTCSESTLGSLEPGGFASLSQLEELVIDGCALESIPANAFQGLTNLQRLTMRTNSLAALRIDSGAFSHLANLTHLDISKNSIRNLPAGEICKLRSVIHLNMSSNEIGSTLDLVGGSGEACLPHLDTLDLSNNEMTSLDWLPASARLISLRHNYVRHLSPGVFNGSSLRELDLSNNQISELPSAIFHNISLHQLSLANNTLSSLPPNTFTGQKEMERLDLSGNLLSSSLTHSALTLDLLSLAELNLAGNQIQGLSPTLLANLLNLQVLRLGSNRLSTFQTPRQLGLLREIDLAQNLIQQVGADDFNGFESLTTLSLAKNQIESVHPAVFRNTTNLTVLDLSENRLNQVPESLKYLTSLETLDIGGNSISEFDKSPLSQMDSLWRLQMSNNLLRNISHAALARMKSLQIIDMSRNRIGKIDRGAFDQNKLLRAIRLDGNQIREIDGIFTHLPELKWLNVSANRIAEFDYALVPRTLHWLDISHNQIRELGNYFDLDGDLSLAFLHAGFNQLQTLAPHHLPDRLETVLLNDNELRQVLPYTFFKKSKLVKVDLSVNKISSVAQQALRLSSELIDLPTFQLGGNPIICDCEMQWFKTINENTSSQRYPLISDLESIYCRLVYADEHAFIPLVEARNDQFLCSYQTHCFSLCQCCQFDSCDCEMTCPDGCSCFHDNSWSKNIIQCSSGNFPSLPDNIPMDATEIFMDGNIIDILRSHTFIGRKNLKSLHLNNSNIEKIENQTFNGLKSLTSLHLENNKLESLEGFEFSGLPLLRELYLQGNKITSIHNATFKALKSLEVLFLQGNSIIDFPVWELAFNPYLVSLRLVENLWSCECEFMNQFTGWVEGSGHKIQDADLLACVSNEATVHSTRLMEYTVAPCEAARSEAAVAKTQVQERDVKDYMPMMIAMLASFALVILLALLTFVFRNSIRVWIHSKYGVRMFESLESKMESGKLFDAYLSYSPVDDAFVRQVFSRELEQVHRYRLCLHHRDLPTNTVTSDTILRASEAAQRSVILVSNNFLKTEWSRYDYKSGILQAVNTGTKKVIFVILGNLEAALLDPSLRLLLKNNIVLHWGEQLFWEKMKYSLPDLTEEGRGAQPQTPSTYSTYRTSGRGGAVPPPPRNIALHI